MILLNKAGAPAFTLIELLVSMTLFVTLMGIASVSFQRVSEGGEKSLRILELHAKADALLRNMEADVRTLQQTMAVHLQTTAEPYTLTFMKTVTDQNETLFHNGTTVSSVDRFARQTERLTDFVWVRWSWEEGAFHRGQSRVNQSTYLGSGASYARKYAPSSMRYIKDLDLKLNIPKGIQNNGIPPTPQRHYDFFEGTGIVHSLDADGDSVALPGQKIEVCEVVNAALFDTSASGDPCELFDTTLSPWRPSPTNPYGDLRHLYTTLELGNDRKLATAYAVRNADGHSVNKDRLNLIGSDETDPTGEKIYKNQVIFLFAGVEYLSMSLLKRDGKVLTAADESDMLGDGGASLDISGIDPDLGDGLDIRPVQLRVSYLLHSIDVKVNDEEDYDGDGDSEELLSAAIRAVVNAEGGTRMDKIRSYKKHALKNGFSSILINQSVMLGL